MRKSSLVAMVGLIGAMSAHAAEPMAPVQRQLFACGHHQHTLMHVSFIQNGCCANGSGCAEALSTTILAKPHTQFRT